MKRITAIALAAVFMLLTTFSIAVGLPERDGGVIELAEITDADFTTRPDDKPEDHLGYTLEGEVHYTVSRTYWRDETEENSYFTVFKRDNTYRRCFELTPDEGYVFTKDTTVFLNGSMDNASYVELRTNGNLRIWSFYFVSAMDWSDDYLFYDDFEQYNPKWWGTYDMDFDGVCWTTNAPGSGMKIYEGDYCLYDRTPEEWEEKLEPCDWLLSHWFHCVNGAEISWYHCSQSGTDEPYSVFLLPKGSQNFGPRIEIWSGTAPAEYEKVAVDISEYDGMDVGIVFLHEGRDPMKELCIDYLTVADVTRTRIESINIKRADIYPITDETPGEHFYYSPDADKHYTVTDHYWYDETTHTRNVEAFRYDHEYSSCFVFTPHEHYYLSDETQISINGNTDLIRIVNANGTISVRTKPVKAMIERPVTAGDVDDDLELTTADAVIILKITVDTYEPTERERKSADANGNGKITPADAVYVLKYAAGILG